MHEVRPDHPPGVGWTTRATSWARSLSWRQDLALPAVVLVVQCAGQAATAAHAWHHVQHSAPQALEWAILVAGPLALIARHRHSAAVLWVTFVLTLFPSPDFAYLSLVVAFFVAAATGHRRPAWLAIVLGYISSVWLVPLASGNPIVPLGNALLLAAWLAVLVIAAEAWRMRRERAAETRAARQVEQRRRQSEERLRMARDLHDVIGHTISLINVQAAVGLDLMDSRPEQARSALAAIKAASKDALEELRTMLVALRQDGELAPRSPTSGLDRLPELVQATRAAGLSVTTELAGQRRPLPTAADLAAYRIIQESLTNVARHAGPARATVRLRYDEHGLDIEVLDDGHGAPGNGHAPPGSGSGIAGMRERAAALGGRLDAGPRPGGGFAVTAHLPLGAQP